MQPTLSRDQVARLASLGRRLEPRIIYDPDIPKGMVVRDALKVVHRLNRHKHKVYLVGGCVRDLLMGVEPVDFDVVTSATLKEVRNLFRNSRLIGRRFPIALIYFKEHNVEVSTFRSGESTKDGVVSSELAELAPDPLAADTWFRDFTVNALVYDPIERLILDYTDGLEDLERRRLRSIGDPFERLESDPVRIIRGLRYAGKLDLEVEGQTEEAMLACAESVGTVSRRRLREEIWKILHSDVVLKIFKSMDQIGLLGILIPELPGLDEDGRLPLEHPLWTYLYRLDHVESKARTDAVLLATLFLPIVDQLIREEVDLRAVGDEILRDRLHDRLEAFGSSHSMARRTRARARDVLMAQLRLLQGPDKGSHPARLFRRKEARDALTIYRIFGGGPEAGADSVSAWEEKYRQFKSGQLAPERGRRRRRRRRRRRKKRSD